MSVVPFETTPAWQTYLDWENDVKPWLQFDTGSTMYDNQVRLVTDFACTWVQNYLGRPVAPTEFFRRFSGYTGLNGSFIDLPYYPVLQVVSVAEFWGLNSGSVQADSCGMTNGSPIVADSLAVPPYVGATVIGTGIPGGTTILSVVAGLEFTMSANFTGSSGTETLNIATKGHVLREQTPSNQGGPGDQMFQCDRLNGQLIRSFQGLIQRPFFPGLRNVEVTWVAGYNPLPLDIKMATLEFANYWWRNTQEAPRTSALVADEYESAARGGLWPAVPNRVTALLEPYTQVGMG